MQRTYQLVLGDSAGVEEDARARLIACGLRKSYRKGQLIWQQGDPPDGFFGVISGAVRSSRSGSDGSRTVYATCGPGDFVGECAFFTGAPRTATLEAVAPSELAWISRSIFEERVRHDPALLHFLLCSVAFQQQQAMHALDYAQRLSTTDRLAIVLRAFHCGPDGTIEATHQELADMIGVSRVALGSALAILAKRGAIQRNYGHVRILDREALRPRGGTVRAAA